MCLFIPLTHILIQTKYEPNIRHDNKGQKLTTRVCEPLLENISETDEFEFDGVTDVELEFFLAGKNLNLRDPSNVIL